MVYMIILQKQLFNVLVMCLLFERYIKRLAKKVFNSNISNILCCFNRGFVDSRNVEISLRQKLCRLFSLQE